MTRTITHIDQLLPTYSEHDAIGNEVTTLQGILREAGYKSEIYVENASPTRRAHCLPAKRLFSASGHETRAVIYHFAVGSDLMYHLATAPFFRIGLYHNITPPQFFDPKHDANFYNACRDGRAQLPMGRFSFDCMWADSKYNAQDLAPYQYPPVSVLPIIKDYSALTRATPSSKMLAKADPHRPTLLVVGRVAPNKAIHDVILLMDLARRVLGQPIRVIFAGNSIHADYEKRLLTLCSDLGLKVAWKTIDFDSSADVILTGGITDSELAACYRIANAFVSMSDHEGFCIPLLEAMAFGLPVVAHGSTAIPETAGCGATIINKYNPEEFVAFIHRLTNDPQFCEQAKQRARHRADEMSFEKLKKIFQETLRKSLPH